MNKEKIEYYRRMRKISAILYVFILSFGIFLVVAGILDALANIIFVLICMSVFILFNYWIG